MSDTDPQAIDQLLRLVDRPVWIVTASSADRPNGSSRRGGLVATFVLQASIDPQRPTVIAGLAPNHFTAELVKSSGAFGLHLITRDQIHHVWRFALGSGRDRDKLAGLELVPSALGVPLLADCLARFECRVLHEYPAGDRIFFWADVVAAGKPRSGAPLVEREVLEHATPEQRSALKADLLGDIDLQRPRTEAWRKSLGNK